MLRLAPADLIPSLQRAGIDFILAGAHGISGWMKQPRATNDVDFIIRTRDKQKAADAVFSAYPHLQIEKHPDVWRFKQGEDYLVDLMLTRAPLFKRILKEYKIIPWGRGKIKIPGLEAALAMKFAAMVGHFRNIVKKHYDAGDFGSMVQRNANINLHLLAELGDLLYPGGGAEVVRYVEDVRAGRTLEV